LRGGHAVLLVIVLFSVNVLLSLDVLLDGI